MNSLLEFFCCPQHGLLRPDNLNLALAFGQTVWMQAFMLVKKAGLW